MVTRNIIDIDEERCNGCGLCIPNCPEGALQIIDNKARMVSDLFCDGLGACIGHCPEGAISIEKREAEPYNERRVMENVAEQGENVIRAHLDHLESHGETGYMEEALAFLKEKGIPVPGNESSDEPEKEEEEEKEKLPCGCAGSAVMDLREEGKCCGVEPSQERRVSRLSQWPVQIKLVPPQAPYFQGADLIIAADCVPFAYPEFHEDLLRGKILLVGCPKLDDANFYREKISHILMVNDIGSITVAHMEVPCCFGLIELVENAVKSAEKDIPVETVKISIRGEVL